MLSVWVGLSGSTGQCWYATVALDRYNRYSFNFCIFLILLQAMFSDINLSVHVLASLVIVQIACMNTVNYVVWLVYQVSLYCIEMRLGVEEAGLVPDTNCSQYQQSTSVIPAQDLAGPGHNIVYWPLLLAAWSQPTVQVFSASQHVLLSNTTNYRKNLSHLKI